MDDEDDGDIAGYYEDMGNGRTICVGEISDALYAEQELADIFGPDGNWGWWLVDFGGPDGTRVIAKCVNQYDAWPLLNTYVCGVRAQDLRKSAA